MPNEPDGTKTPQAGRHKIALWFTVKNDMRFLSHRDTMQLMQRALARAQIPVRFSQGFNPHMRLSLPLPRSVGMTSEAEVAILEMEEPSAVRVQGNDDITPRFHIGDWSAERLEEMNQAFRRQLPRDVELLGLKTIPPQTITGASWAQYRITLSERADRDELSNRLDKFHQSESWTVHRARHGRHPAKDLDMKHSVTELCLEENGLWCTIASGQQSTVRISELLASLELNTEELVSEIRRTAVGYPRALCLDN